MAKRNGECVVGVTCFFLHLHMDNWIIYRMTLNEERLLRIWLIFNLKLSTTWIVPISKSSPNMIRWHFDLKIRYDYNCVWWQFNVSLLFFFASLMMFRSTHKNWRKKKGKVIKKEANILNEYQSRHLDLKPPYTSIWIVWTRRIEI